VNWTHLRPKTRNLHRRLAFVILAWLKAVQLAGWGKGGDKAPHAVAGPGGRARAMVLILQVGHGPGKVQRHLEL